MKSKKVFLVLERKALKMLSYVNDELYKELYPRYLRKIGINIPEDYREGKSGYIDPSAYFDGSDYRLISIGKNTTISRDVVVLTHDFSIVKGLQAIGQEATGHFLKPVKIGDFARNSNRRQYYLRGGGQCCTVKSHRTVL